MHSIGHFILERNPDAKIICVTSEEFTNEVIESIRSGNAAAMNKFREKYRTIDVLMIDDVQFIIGKESTQEEFFHTFNALHSAGKQIILTSDKPPKEMETLEERIRSRFEWGLMADIGTPDYETRMAILRKKIEADEMNLSDEILNYIATNIKSNIRELEGALNKLLAYSNLEKTDITMEIAQKELQNIITPDKPKEITPQLIIEVVSEHFQISLDQMISKNRSKDIARPRQIAMYLCKNMTDTPLDSIGALLGKRVSRDLVRSGAQKGFVSAVFTDLPRALRELLDELALSGDEPDTLYVQRQISADGKSTCRVNMKPASAAVLRQLAPYLIDIHGQNDGQKLLDEAHHIEYLDGYAGCAEILEPEISGAGDTPAGDYRAGDRRAGTPATY